MYIQEAIQEALRHWSSRHAESTVLCQQCYFSALLQTAEEKGMEMPCQELYDCFMENTATPAVRFSRMQAIKAVDFVAKTHATTLEGTFYNEPPFPTKKEAQTIMSKMNFPICCPMDISVLIVCGSSEINCTGMSSGSRGQYWHSWKDIRTYSFLWNGSMDYSPGIMKQYLAELDMKYDDGSIPETSYYMHRKAALIIMEIARAGQYKWKRVLREPIRNLENPVLENIRQQYLSFLKKNNYSDTTIRVRDYIFRNMIRFSGIHSTDGLLHLSAADVGTILKGFAGKYHDMDSPVTLVRLTLRYLYEQGLLEENRAEMVMAPFRHHGSLPCYIPEKEDGKLEGVKKSPLRKPRASL